MIAAVCAWHEHHQATASQIERQFEQGAPLIAPSHALVEAYAVLTRLPPPHRLSPADAWTLLNANFVGPAAAFATLPGKAYPELLERLAKDAIAGGRTYDAVIAASVQHAGVATLLTLNRRHFDPPPDGVSIVDPSG